MGLSTDRGDRPRLLGRGHERRDDRRDDRGDRRDDRAMTDRRDDRQDRRPAPDCYADEPNGALSHA